MQTINIHEAKTHFSKLIQSVLEGEEVVIAKAGQPLVRMVPLLPSKKNRFGTLKGKIKIADDFDAPLPEDILQGFYGENQ